MDLMICNDNKGQMSIEVIFLFAISIMILIAFTIPISQIAIENNLDVLNSLNTKLDTSKLANSIDSVYTQGSGAQQVVTIETNNDFNVFIKSKQIYSEITLHDGKLKKFSQNHKADNVISNLKMEKGVNKVLISWPEDSKNIVITKI